MEFKGRKIPVNIEDEMKRSYLDYAMSVIVGRALPDVRDGLKPVHRRILFAMKEMGNLYNRPHKKSARIVGDVIGKYHPHGDAAVYDTMVRMAQDFNMRYSLIDGQGNFGSIDADPPAAMRYTEVRMAKLASELLKDIDKDTVEFGPNYDESMDEPKVLPCALPNLILNGASGIAVGMTTNIPPHNMGEVIEAINRLIDYPNISIDELTDFIPGPDFPTGGIIYGNSMIKEAYNTGKGIIQLRARVMVETNKRTGRESIIITEMPYQVNKARLLEKIAELIRERRVEGISDLRDESDREGIRVVIELKKDTPPQVILNHLYKTTSLQVSVGIIMLALVNGEPRILDLKEILKCFIEHRKDVVIRRTKFELKKAEQRAHILEGLRIALKNLDAIIKLIRSSSSPDDAKDGLVKKFKLTLIQAQAILDMRLQRLTQLEREKIMEEYRELLKYITQLEDILSSERRILGVIKEELNGIAREYSDSRRTEILEKTEELSIEDYIVEENMAVTVSHRGYIKRNPLTLYTSQRRGGRGKIGMIIRDEDFMEKLFVASTHDFILFFTDLGRVYWLKVHEIPQAGRAARGKAIVNLIDMRQDERITAILPVRDFEKGRYVFMATVNGMVKKSDLKYFSNLRSGGIIALGLKEGDRLTEVLITDGKQEILLASSDGKAIRFKESDVRPMGRTASGVKGIGIGRGARVVGMAAVKTGAGTILTVTENGYGKRSPLEDYRLQSRGGLGLINIKTAERNGSVVGIKVVTDEDDLMLITNKGKIIRLPVAQIRITGRNTMGVRLITMDEAERVASVAHLAEK